MRAAARAGAQALALLGLFGVIACTHGAGHQVEARQSAAAPDGPTTALAARFVETWRQPEEAPYRSDWFFARSATRIETAQRDYAEVWERDDRQEMTLQRVFHGDHKLIEYTSGQLRAEQRLTEWSVLASILDQRTLDHLEKQGERRVLGQPATRYAGTLGNERIEVVWLTRQALPAKIERSSRGTTYTLELKDLRMAPDPSWPTASRDRVAAYERLDAADLGDREHEPFVRRVLQMDSGRGRPSHAH